MNEKRPILKLEYSTLERFLTAVAFAVLILDFILLFVNWNTIPSTIAVHIDGSGNANGWGNKSTLLMLPIVNVFIFLLLFVLSKFPHIYNYTVNITEENAEYQYRNARTLMIALNAIITSMFTYISWTTVKLALYGKNSGFQLAFIVVFVIFMFATFIIYIKKAMKQMWSVEKQYFTDE